MNLNLHYSLRQPVDLFIFAGLFYFIEQAPMCLKVGLRVG